MSLFPGSMHRARPTLGARLRRAGLAVALSPVFTVPGYWAATGAGAGWALLAGRGPLGRRLRRRGDLLVADTLPTWAFGRGGTTVGGVFLTSPEQAARIGEPVYQHEAVHREQWRRFGLWMIPLYLLAGRDPLRNRFEIEAGLAAGGYRLPPVGVEAAEDAGARPGAPDQA